MEALLYESIDVIGIDKIQEMKHISDNAAFFDKTNISTTMQMIAVIVINMRF